MPNKLKRVRPDRAHKRMIAAHVEADVFREFKILAAEQLTTTDAMVAKAMALLFESYKKPVPAELAKKLKALGLGAMAGVLWLAAQA